jgi:hypothetical protein
LPPVLLEIKENRDGFFTRLKLNYSLFLLFICIPEVFGAAGIVLELFKSKITTNGQLKKLKKDIND